jgi:uncharacterized protein YndB with AHSA1/START domain
MYDTAEHIHSTIRQVFMRPIPAGEAQCVKLQRDFDTPIAAVWKACTDPDQLGLWFLDLSGDLRIGGEYQLKGNAHGEILACDPPYSLRVTWVFGEKPTGIDVTEVELYLSADEDGRTNLTLEHAVVVNPKLWNMYGPGAAGVGWDMSLLALGCHLHGQVIGDRSAWKASTEIRHFIGQSAEGWGTAHLAAGASPSGAASAVRNTTSFYAPDDNVLSADDNAPG